MWCLFWSPLCWQVYTGELLFTSSSVTVDADEPSAELMQEFLKLLRSIDDLGLGVGGGATSRYVSLFDTAGELIDLEASSFEHAKRMTVHMLPPVSCLVQESGCSVAHLSIQHCHPDTPSTSSEDGSIAEVDDIRYDFALTHMEGGQAKGAKVLHLQLSARLGIEVRDEDKGDEEDAGGQATSKEGSTTERGIPRILSPSPWHRLTTMSPSEENRVSSALGPGSREELLVPPSPELANIPMSRRSMRTLGPGKWLNDEVMNIFLKLIKNRLQECNLPQTYIASTCLYTKLTVGGYNFERVRRWTRICNFQQIRRIIVPVLIHGNHWVVTIFDLVQRTVEYYNSLGRWAAPGPEQLDADGVCIDRNLMQWIVDVGAVTGDEVPEFRRLASYAPEQRNNYDCGVFVLYYVFCRTTDIEPIFSQEDMAQLRRRTVLDILNTRLSL